MVRLDAVRSRPRLVLGIVAVVIAIVTAIVSINRFVLQAEWWQVDRSVTTDPAPRLSDIGPPAGPVRVTWQLATPVQHGLPSYDQVAHAIVHGQLVVVSGRGFDVRDASTGHSRWHYYRDGWTLLGWTATARSLVAYLERRGHRETHLIVGFDTVSGRLLWRDDSDVPATTERSTLRWPAGSGVVLTTDDRRTVLRGRSVATGRQKWTMALPARCVLPEGAQHASADGETVAALALDCGDQGRVVAIDPSTGRILWSEVGESADLGVAIAGEVTAVYDGTALRAYDRSGREFLTLAGDDVCTGVCPIAVTGGRLVVAHAAPGARGGRNSLGRLAAVNITSGKTEWRREAKGYAALTIADGRLYALRGQVADTLLPAGIDIIDVDTGAGTTVPAPIVVRSGVGGGRPWLGAGGGLLYVATPEATPRPFGTARMVALRGGARSAGPAELGGVAAADWPDACELLKEHDLATSGTTAERYRTIPQRIRVGEVRLPRPVECTYEPVAASADEEQSAAALTVTVAWTADSADAATAMFETLRAAQGRVRQLRGVGDEAYELGPPSGTVAVRVDRHIVTVSAHQSAGVATRLARAAANRLRARVEPAARSDHPTRQPG